MSGPPPPPAPAARPARLDAFEAVYQTAQLTLRRTLRGRRILGALAVVLVPAALAWLVSSRGADDASQQRFFFSMLSDFHFGIAVPVVAMLFATAFPWPEAEEGTLTYWFTAPVRRTWILVGRFAAAWLVGTLLLPLCVLAIWLPLGPATRDAVAGSVRVSLASTLLVYPAYLALFQAVSTAFRRGLAACVVFVFVENFLSILSGAFVRLTLVYYVRSQLWPVVPRSGRTSPERLLRFDDPASNATCVAVFAIVTAVALLVSVLLVERIEYRGRTSQPG